MVYTFAQELLAQGGGGQGKGQEKEQEQEQELTAAPPPRPPHRGDIDAKSCLFFVFDQQLCHRKFLMYRVPNHTVLLL